MDGRAKGRSGAGTSPVLIPRLGGWTSSDSKSWLVLAVDGSEFPHIVPSFGPRHELDMGCWCHPVFEDEHGEAVVSHNVGH